MKGISTTEQNASLSDTVSFLEKESRPTGSLVSLDGVRFLFSCGWTIKSQWAPCPGLPSPGSSQASKTHLATWAWAVSQRAVDLLGLCPSLCSMRDSHPLSGVVPHAHVPHQSLLFSPSQPPDLLLLPLSCFPPFALQAWFLIPTSCYPVTLPDRVSNLCKTLTKAVRPKECHKYPVLSILQVISDKAVTLLFKSTEQTRKSQYYLLLSPILLKHAKFIHWCKRQVHLIPSPPSTGSLSLKFTNVLLSFLWKWAIYYLLSSLFLFLFLSH